MSRSDDLYNLLTKIFILLDDGDRRLLSQYDLSSARFYALLHLQERPGLSPSELSNLMLCDKSNITRLLKGMEAEGLVQRRPHETDGRVLRLSLTDYGQSVCREVLAAHKARNQERFNHGLQEVEQATLFNYLANLKESLEEDLAAVQAV